MIYWTRLLGAFIAFILFSVNVLAHPVIWKDGVANMLSVDNTTIHAHSLYSLDYDWAVGVHHVRFREAGLSYTLGQSNWLLKRWNGTASQGNFYVMSGLGVAHQNENVDTLFHAGFQADWETRRYYTLFSTEYYGLETPQWNLRGRLGIAPYIADFDGFHTWLMLQVDDVIVDGDHSLTAMPVLRLFWDNILLEFGTNFSGESMAVAMYHF